MRAYSFNSHVNIFPIYINFISEKTQDYRLSNILSTFLHLKSRNKNRTHSFSERLLAITNTYQLLQSFNFN